MLKTLDTKIDVWTKVTRTLKSYNWLLNSQSILLATCKTKYNCMNLFYNIETKLCLILQKLIVYLLKIYIEAIKYFNIIIFKKLLKYNAV